MISYLGVPPPMMAIWNINALPMGERLKHQRLRHKFIQEQKRPNKSAIHSEARHSESLERTGSLAITFSAELPDITFFTVICV